MPIKLYYYIHITYLKFVFFVDYLNLLLKLK